MKDGILLQKAAQPDIIKLVDGRVFELIVNNSNELAEIKAMHQVIDTSRQKDKIKVHYIAATDSQQPGAVAVNATLEDAYLFLTQSKA